MEKYKANPKRFYLTAATFGRTALGYDGITVSKFWTHERAFHFMSWLNAGLKLNEELVAMERVLEARDRIHEKLKKDIS